MLPCDRTLDSGGGHGADAGAVGGGGAGNGMTVRVGGVGGDVGGVSGGIVGAVGLIGGFALHSLVLDDTTVSTRVQAQVCDRRHVR